MYWHTTLHMALFVYHLTSKWPCPIFGTLHRAILTIGAPVYCISFCVKYMIKTKICKRQNAWECVVYKNKSAMLLGWLWYRTRHCRCLAGGCICRAEAVWAEGAQPFLLATTMRRWSLHRNKYRSRSLLKKINNYKTDRY